MMHVPLLAAWVGLCAAALTLAVAGLGFAAGWRTLVRLAALAFATTFFIALTQLPLPDPTLLKPVCPLFGAQPNWVPFYTVARVAEEWRMQIAHPTWIPFHVLSQGERAVASWLRYQSSMMLLRSGWSLPALLNFLVCLPIGALAAPFLRRVRAALAGGLALSLLIELTQLTGTWGLYPCAYRKFDADDLLLNTLGVVLGFLAARRVGRAHDAWRGRSGARGAG